MSVYVKAKFRNRGIGKKLIDEILATGQKCGLHTIISRITEGNQASIHLHKMAGFHDIGVMREVGRKFDRLLDVRLMQLIYPQESVSKN